LEDKSLVQILVAKARRRCITHLVLDQSAFALTIGMGGAILLLLVGTAILNWYWIVLLTLASLGAGLYRFRKSIPSFYTLAQRIDRRLNLADALSTAIFFSSPDAPGNEAIRQRQRTEAESIARTIDVRATVPYARSRYTYPAVAVAAVAFGLFAVRFAVTGSLSLQPSLVKIALDTFFPQSPEVAKAKKARDRFKLPPMDKGDPDSPTTQNDQAPDSMLDAKDNPDTATAPDAADNSKQAAKDGRQDPAEDAKGENSDKDKGDKSPSGNDSNQENGPQSDSKDGKQQQQNGKQDSKQGSSNDNSSLMDKLKDAMANMLNKMKPSPKDGQSEPQNQQKSQQSQQDKSQEKGQQSQKQNQSADADSQSQPSDSGDQNQSAEAKGSEKSSDKDASKDSKSGIGSADGDKSAKEAEQAQAMGKISEIIGKRSQNVTGEVMVEVGSSKQQLKTPWAQKQAAHAEAGSEIHRDEVPLMYQQFVQQYFEEIRKTPATAAKQDAKPTPKNPG
jgi:hypothetical protein